jgi:DNA-binding transcriptional ArsR family regulator
VQRIRFTPEDLARTGVATLGPLAETLFALRLLQARDAPALFDGWRRRVRPAISGRWLQIAPLFKSGISLDLVTIVGSVSDHEEAHSAVLGIADAVLAAELEIISHRSLLPAWTVDLARGDRGAREVLADGVDEGYSAVLAELWPQIRRHLDAERARYGQALMAGGVEQLFAGLAPHARWSSPDLELLAPRSGDTVGLNGYGLVIVPSVFCWRPEYSWMLGGGPSILFVPALRDPVGARGVLAPTLPPGPAVGTLLGRSRAAALEVIASAPGITTGALATHLALSAASASQHATVLRDAGLVASDRFRNTVRHTITDLGEALLGPSTVTKR